MTRWLVLLLALGIAGDAEARPKKKRARYSKRVTRPADPTATPAYRYGNLQPATCIHELRQREIPFALEAPSLGVLAPVRITGPIRGITFRTNQPAELRATSRWEIADCRLVLALDDFAQILVRHDIVEVRHYSMWRPPRSWPEGKLALQHAGAVAIDTGRFLGRDGGVLDVDDDFHGRIGAKTCGDGARPRKVTPASTKLRAILCETVDAGIFNIVLTPNFNRPHKNHFHLEITGATWFLVH